MGQVELQHDFGQKMRGYIPTGPADDTTMLLMQMFKHLPPEGKQNLADDAFGCISNQELYQMAVNIDLGFLRPMKVAGEKRPPSTHTLPVDDASFEQQLIDDPDLWEQLCLRKDCLRRDGNMCVVSKVFNACSKNIPPGKETMRLEVAHALPLSLGDFSEKFWNCLYRYFPGVHALVGIGHANLNTVENAMMVATPLIEEFSDFLLAFEPTSVPSLYHVKTFPGFATSCNRFLPEDGLFTLTLHDRRYALPHTILLETHYILATILHATGRAGLVNDILEDYRDSCGLAKDGSTDIARLLSVILPSAVGNDRGIM